jgi:putative heme-binding domain-containing protein
MQLIETTDGRVVSGLVVAESDNALTVQTANEKVVIPTAEVERRVQTGTSLMPEGLLQQLSPDEVRDLFAYLTGPEQVPPASEKRQSATPNGQQGKR